MAAEQQCPEVARLRDLLEATVSEKQQMELTEHLEQCDDCRRRFEELTGASGLLTDVADPHDHRQPPQRESGLEEAIGQLLADGPGEAETSDGEPSTAEEFSLEFLSPSDNPDHLGLLGDYEISEVIGRGGMGVVLKGHDAGLNRTVAIKVLNPSLASNATARKRFRREAQAAAAVSHDHVVAIHAVDEAAELPLLVMEYVDGVSLEERIKRNGPLELKEILRIGMQTASGLAAAHDQGLVHRDIKPANILLENGVERVKITDFGLARAADDVQITQTGVVAGTPQYMSPEQAKAEVVDHRSDLFSLGSVLYAMCTGRPPFRTTTILDAIRRVCEDTPRPIRKVNPEIPEWLVEIVDKLLAKDPEHRFQTASEVAELLGQHLAHLQEPEAVPQPPRVGKTRRRAVRGKHRLRWAVAAVVLAILLGGLGLTEATGVTKVREFLATVLRIKTPQGTLVVKIDDPDVNVVVDGDGDAITLTGIGDHEITLQPGRHQWQAIKEGKAVQSEWVTITSVGQRVVEVSLVPSKSTPGAADPSEARTWKPYATLTGHEDWVYRVAFSPDGETLASGSKDGIIKLWDLRTQDELAVLKGHEKRVYFVAFSPDGKTLASASDETISLWDPKTFQHQATLKGHSNLCTCVAFSPDGKILASSSDDRTIMLWDLETLEMQRSFHGHTGSVMAVAFSPDGKMLASASRDHTLRFWDPQTGDQLGESLGFPARWVWSVVFSPDGKVLVSGGGTELKPFCVWDVEKREQLTTLGHGAYFGTFSADGDFFASSSGTDASIRLFETRTWRPLANLIGHTGTACRCVVFSPDGRTLASSGEDRTVRLWDVSQWTATE